MYYVKKKYEFIILGDPMSKKKIAVIGAGIAGVKAAKTLSKKLKN